MHKPDEPAEQEAYSLLNEIQESAFQSSLLALNLFLEASETGAGPSALSAAEEAGRLATQCGAAAAEAVALTGGPAANLPLSTPAETGRLRRLGQRARVEANLVCEIASGVTPRRERTPTSKENLS